MKKLFFISFVEEMIQNPDFFAYVGGRIEVYDDKSEFNIEEIRFLTKLKVLNASNNLMTGLPAEIGQLADLEILNLSNNQLTGLPNELGNLKNLKILNLSGNKYSEQDLEVIRNSLPQTVNIIVD